MRRTRDSYTPRNPHLPPRPSWEPSSRPNGNGNMYQFGGQSRPRSEFSFRSRISQRDLLTHVPSTIETPVLSENHASNRFRNLENLTDSEEEEMSEDENSDDHGRVKKRRIAKDDGVTEPQAKWSNPDPYTALPPAPDSAHKRVDVVRLIRKARNETDAQQSTIANQDDFISFGDFGDDFPAPPSNAPRGPRSDPAPYYEAPDLTTRKILGKRKHDEFEDDSLMGGLGRTRFHKSGKVLAAWQAIEGSSATPWVKGCNAHDSPMIALHREVVDFYEWVKPKDFESAMRLDLVDRLSRELKRWKVGGRLEAFGSYAAGLYLPTGDMDLVYNYQKSGRFANPKKDVYDVAHFLQSTGLARPGSIVPIGKAKVPIVKFVDHLTGLKVDLSFNNDTGITANETFKQWQATYPAVGIIVAVVKQFLMIRGLNDNASGGLGGFATICMVTSLVQNLPAQKNPNLGELLIEFFNLYGNLFNVQAVGIRMDPPGYFSKRLHSLMGMEKPERLVIIDPNRSDNNITGGSSEYLRISHVFAKTYEAISSRLDDFEGREQREGPFSFLSDVIGGNFSAYTAQRVTLSTAYKRELGGTVSDEPLQLLEPQAAQAHNNKGGARLTRLRSLFPELAGKLANRKTIGPNQALSVGGWTSKEAMSRDIDAREMQQMDKKRREGPQAT